MTNLFMSSSTIQGLNVQYMFAAYLPKSEMTIWKHNIHKILRDHFRPLLLCVRISLLAYTVHIISFEILSILCIILTQFLNS